MLKAIKPILFFILFNTALYGCSLCSANVPSVEVNTNVTNQKDHVIVDVKWSFHEQFVSTLEMYDLNDNKTFENNEKLLIEDALVTYLKENNYLTDILYLHKDQEFNPDDRKKIKPIRSNLELKEKKMLYTYSFKLDIEFKKDHKIYIGFYDIGGNFNFLVKDIIIKGYDEFKRIEPAGFFGYIYFYKKKASFLENDEKKDIEKPKSLFKVAKEEEKKEENWFIYTYLEQKLTSIKKGLENLLEDIKENNSIISYFWLLLFSFVYGLLHALGPGHGKSLVGAYFLGENKSYMKAFNISALIGLVHTFSAFLLTLIIYYFVGLLFSNIVTDVEKFASKLSAVIIIGIALYLIYKKIAKKTDKAPELKTFTTMASNNNPSLVRTTNNNHVNNHSCGCSACKTTSTDLGVVLAAGMIPCPGTVSVFIFTFGLGIYFVGFLSALFMSLGMALIIFLTASASLKVKQSAGTSTLAVKIFEYGSLFFILGLGVILFFIS